MLGSRRSPGEGHHRLDGVVGAMTGPDPIFADPRLVAVYDEVDGPRDDLDPYEALVAELGARRVLDVGCGTGCLAVRLAALGHEVVGVDPAAASLAVARAKPHADRVRWIHGDATTLPAGVDADLAVMTGNVAQVFTTDEAWAATLAAVHRAVRPGGHLVLETRRPEARAWETWDGGHVTTPTVEVRRHVVEVAGPLVTFELAYRFPDGHEAVSTSTLRFRTEAEVRSDLEAAGFAVDDVREAPDRPGLEMVFVTSRRDGAGLG